MSNREEEKTLLEELREKLNERSELLTPEAALAKKLSLSTPSTMRLELTFNEVTKTVLLRGNQDGIQHLLEMIQLLSGVDIPSGNHAHFDSQTNLSQCDSDLALIIQRED